MRHAIGDVLPLAVAAAISPFPIIGVVLMLVTPRGRLNGSMFILGWVAGLAIVGAIGLAVVSGAGASEHGSPSDTANLFQVGLGTALLAFAIRSWRKRPTAGQEPTMPKWMSAVDEFSPPQAALTGVALAAVNPKNLLLTLAAATTIAATGLGVTDQVIAFIAYALIATIGVAVPLVILLAMGERSQATLEDLKAWLAHNNATIMAVIFLILGAKVLGQGIAG